MAKAPDNLAYQTSGHGDSMINAGINDGDLLVRECQPLVLKDFFVLNTLCLSESLEGEFVNEYPFVA